MVKLLKYCKYLRLASSRVSHVSGWHLPSLLFAFCWFLVALFLLTAVWKFLSFFFLTQLSWSDTDSYAGWDSWTPPVNLLSEPTWGIRRWWPTYVAKKIIPSRGSIVFVFSSVSPFHDANHLTDPWSFGEREQAQQLLTAVIHGLITRIIWIYPSGLRHPSGKFHHQVTHRVGLAVFELPTSGDGRRKSFVTVEKPSPSPKQSVHRTDDSNWLGAVCVCDEQGNNCVLPFLRPLWSTISSSACTQNATVVYESMVDVLAQSLASAPTTSTAPFEEKHSRIDRMVSGFRRYGAPSNDWLLDPVHPNRPPSVVVLLDTNYFVRASSTTAFSVFPTSSENGHHNEPPNAANVLIQKYLTHLQRLHDDLSAQLSSHQNLSGDSFPLSLIHLCTKLFFILLPTEPTEWISSLNVLRNGACGSRSPHSVSLTSLSEYRDFLHWRSMLSTPFTHSANETCERFRLLTWTVFSIFEWSVKLDKSAYEMWHWLCHLERSKLAHLTRWTPCYNHSVSSAQMMPSVPSRIVQLCPHPEVISRRQLQLVDRMETEFLVDRLQMILCHVSTPGYVAVVNRWWPTSENSSDPLQAVCNRFNRIY